MKNQFEKYILALVTGILAFSQVAYAQSSPHEIPWAWYAARIGGLVAFLLLYISIFLGLSIRTPLLDKIIAPKYSFEIHCWLSLQAAIFAFLHGAAMFFDKTLHFSLVDIFVPFVSTYQKGPISMGIIGFYLMVILLISSYSKKYITHRIWRTLHTFNIGLYFILIGHALTLGTDLKDGILRSIFIWMNVLMMLLFVYNLCSRLFAKKLTPNS